MYGIDPSRVIPKEGQEISRFIYGAIGMFVLKDPVQCSTCQSAFGKACIDKWRFANSNRCPHKCEGKMKLEKVHKILKNMLDDLVIKCEYFEDGCKEIFSTKHELEGEFTKIKGK